MHRGVSWNRLVYTVTEKVRTPVGSGEKARFWAEKTAADAGAVVQWCRPAAFLTAEFPG
jgi:hypothetical protein